MYESRCGRQEGSTLPDLICVITGKGPEKEYYRNLIAERQWECVKVVMPWLEPQDYPLMLGSADLGVCLHMSSSGVDLPMKVVDMFGCGLPVVAKKFDALPELVKDGINGILFDTPEELSDKIVQWFEEFPNASYERRRRPFTNQIERFRTSGWSDHWRAVALPVFQNLL
jgi:beta-1,4-mannosyltransferase